MRPVSYYKSLPKQTFFGVGGKKETCGDCWRCAIAAVIGYPFEKVPHFLQVYGPLDCDKETAKWLWKEGYEIVRTLPYMAQALDGGYIRYPMIAAGPTERSRGMGRLHAVVYQNGKLVYDPHPTEVGLTAITSWYLVVPIKK